MMNCMAHCAGSSGTGMTIGVPNYGANFTSEWLVNVSIILGDQADITMT